MQSQSCLIFQSAAYAAGQDVIKSRVGGYDRFDADVCRRGLLMWNNKITHN